jgi:hypothetical protein
MFLPDYPNGGLAADMRELFDVWLRVHKLSLEQQALYADAVVRCNIDNNEFLFLSLLRCGQPATTTAVGNLAFVVLYVKDEAIKDKAREILGNFVQQRNLLDEKRGRK